MKHYDAVIIGAGQAGIPLAKKLAEAGKKTAIIEKRMIGGTCINDGCTPTKAMIASAATAHKAKKANELGVEIGSINVNFKKIKKRKDDIVEAFRNSAEKGLKSTEGLDVIFAEASFSGAKELSLKMSDGKDEKITAELIFINTGAKTSIPKIKGLETINYLTSTSILDLEEVPEHLIIVGGNYIGLEFGQMFHRFGSKVTILEKSSRIMSREDEDISETISEILVNEGLNIITGVHLEEFEEKQKAEILIKFTAKGKNKSIKASHVLIAAGRTPQTEDLALKNIGVDVDEKGYIIVNQKLETNIKGIYALGDVKGGPAFTHIAYNDFTIVYRNLTQGSNYSTKNRLVPYCMFTDPQLGRIGISESEAIEKGINFKVAKIQMSQVGRSVETGETLGFMKAIVDAESKEILGAAILASEGGEIVSVLQMAMQGGITYEEIRYGIFAHPTYAESLNNLFMKIDS